MSASVVIANFGTANIHSVVNALKAVGASSVSIAQSASDIANAERLVLPGQGSIPTFMHGLENQADMKAALITALSEGMPVLGICLGQQCLYEYSEEGVTNGLGLLEGRVIRFSADNKKVPHMGWNQLLQTREHPLWQGVEDDAWFYFVHSYFVDTVGQADSIGVTNYEVDFTAATASKNVFAVQFHPEKSEMNGLTLLKNFLVWDGLER